MYISRTALTAAAGSVLLAAAALPAAAATAPASPPRALDAHRAALPAEGTVPADDLLDALGTCRQISKGKYRTDNGAPADVPVCERDGVVHWTADLDIDCDGVRTRKCNSTTDRWFQPHTSFQQSNGRHLNAAKLPFVVVPGPSGIWDYRDSGIHGGTVAALVYRDRVVYAVVGDTGPTGIIGEASYAAADALGIDPHPTYGGASSGVTYILFKNVRAAPIESHEAAVAIGDRLARRYVRGAKAALGDEMARRLVDDALRRPSP
ncbi:glycoside hydrolase family 75 protein [Streptomyces sp. PKU-EA00015]|uniref:glycoside hydrolase family 75 protein n=1 Tax=Streptomyces sp. PKU-EA00015 TaxID=2748326 RepID=UPI0015A1EDE7|nr:glycoside hydrolase family 75 protein [Streptomyces sp. PKU-EA00015]NWF26616.1 glycoside hydrolase family 75 protein [Streptomyces sp. PKU-EA00015]